MLIRCGIVLLVSVALACPVFADITSSLALIADATTPMPGGTRNFQYFGEPSIENQSIAFAGSDGMGREGIYRFSSGALERIADTTTLDPVQSQPFRSFGHPVFAGSDIIFFARTSGTTGIYRWTNGILSAVAGPVVDGTGEPSWGQLPTASSSFIYAQTTDPGAIPLAIQRLRPLPVETIATAGAAAPGGGTYGFLRRMTTDGPRVAFINQYGGESRWGLMVGEAGNVAVIAQPGTPLPNGQMEDFDRLVLQGQKNGKVIFVAKPVGVPASAYVWEAGQISLAFQGTATPSGGAPFDEFRYVGLSDDSQVAIGRTGVHIKHGAEQVQVFSWSTYFQGRLLAGAVLGPAGVNNHAITLKVFLGDNTEGILRVNYSTVPSADADGDSVVDSVDNCTQVFNPGQCDSDGDGYGNHCDGDLTNNGVTNAQDYVVFRSKLGAASVAPTYNSGDLNCNGNVNAQDYVLFRQLLGRAPGPSGLHP